MATADVMQCTKCIKPRSTSLPLQSPFYNGVSYFDAKNVQSPSYRFSETGINPYGEQGGSRQSLDEMGSATRGPHCSIRLNFTGPVGSRDQCTHVMRREGKLLNEMGWESGLLGCAGESIDALLSGY
jgi:hypothetical protein